MEKPQAAEEESREAARKKAERKKKKADDKKKRLQKSKMSFALEEDEGEAPEVRPFKWNQEAWYCVWAVDSEERTASRSGCVR